MQHGIHVTQPLLNPVPTMHWSGKGNLKLQGVCACVCVWVFFIKKKGSKDRRCLYVFYFLCSTASVFSQTNVLYCLSLKSCILVFTVYQCTGWDVRSHGWFWYVWETAITYWSLEHGKSDWTTLRRFTRLPKGFLSFRQTWPGWVRTYTVQL